MHFNNNIKSIVMSIKDKIKSFLGNIWDLIHQWFEAAEDTIKSNIHIAVVVTEGVKKFIDNPVGDFLLTVIDDKIPGNVRDKVKEILPKVLLGLHIIDDCRGLSEEEAPKCISVKLLAISNENKDMLYRELSFRVAKELSDGQFAISDIIGLVEWYYRNRVKNKQS